ncbi:hypothetical protein [Acidiferrobacter sp. SPIII_3]|uniref:hypothetical protein n=1 Tax=Acidiferrobacter sp. SPIII_3 TaxID=1281578 RepID=UPI00197AB53B|nr:hypothetical protein [Acidiferrobacter sp. SPIII_3]
MLMLKLKDQWFCVWTHDVRQVKAARVLRVRKLRVGSRAPNDGLGHDYLDCGLGIIRQITVVAYQRRDEGHHLPR